MKKKNFSDGVGPVRFVIGYQPKGDSTFSIIIIGQTSYESRMNLPSLFFCECKPETYRDELLNRVDPSFKKTYNLFRRALLPDHKLAITFRHLASRDLVTLQYNFTVARNTISRFLLEVFRRI